MIFFRQPFIEAETLYAIIINKTWTPQEIISNYFSRQPFIQAEALHAPIRRGHHWRSSVVIILGNPS